MQCNDVAPSDQRGGESTGADPSVRRLVVHTERISCRLEVQPCVIQPSIIGPPIIRPSIEPGIVRGVHRTKSSQPLRDITLSST